MTDVAIIANGGANIASLRFALDRLGASSQLTADVDELRRARRVILPGVGAAADAMERLHSLGLASAIPTLTQPVLGICLGMQLLFEGSEEGDTKCLGIFPARVTRFPDRQGFPVPHMGWNQVVPQSGSPLTRGLGDDAYVYFVHSYAAPVGPWTQAVTSTWRSSPSRSARAIARWSSRSCRGWPAAMDWARLRSMRRMSAPSRSMRLATVTGLCRCLVAASAVAAAAAARLARSWCSRLASMWDRILRASRSALAWEW